jgi:hypothetical protein
MNYRNLIKKILREDFDWTEKIEPVELGGNFEEDDISYDDKDAKVYLGDEGKVIYNLDEDEVIDYTYDGYDDWVLVTLINSNGDYDSYGGDGYIDEDEINYMGGYLDDKQKERLQKILDYYVKKENLNKRLDVDNYLDDSFSELERPLLKLYRGRYDWPDFTSEALSYLGDAIERNRWQSIGDYYVKFLSDNNVNITAYNRNDIRIEMSFPYKGSNNLTEVLTKIGLNDVSWSDYFYEDWDSSGAEDGITTSFNYLLDNIEDKINEETNS